MRRPEWTFLPLLLASGLHGALSAQQVGPGGAPGAGTSFTCNAASNCAALNAANTFTSAQAIDFASPTLTLINPSTPGTELVIGQNAGYGYLAGAGGWNPQLLEFPLETTTPVLGTASNGIFGWTSGELFQGLDTGMSRTGPATVSIGNGGEGDSSGWLQSAAIGNGSSGNTDLRGHLTLASGTASYSFAKAYAVAPTCVATDSTSAAAVKVATTTATLTVTGTGSDVLNYVCAD